MCGPELDALYRQGQAVGIPAGRVRGTAILAPGTRRNGAMADGHSGRLAGKGLRSLRGLGREPLLRPAAGPRPGVSGPELARRRTRPSCSTTAGPRESMPRTGTRSARSPPASSSASCTPGRNPSPPFECTSPSRRSREREARNRGQMQGSGARVALFIVLRNHGRSMDERHLDDCGGTTMNRHRARTNFGRC